MTKIIIALVGVLLMATSALAANTKPTLNVQPVVTIGDHFSVGGCGYKPGFYVTARLYAADNSTLLTTSIPSLVNSSGCFKVFTSYVYTASGQYIAYSYQSNGNPTPGAFSHPEASLAINVT